MNTSTYALRPSVAPWKFLAAGLGIAALFILSIPVIGGILYLKYDSNEKQLRNLFNAEVAANQVDYDNMYKTIAQKYEVKGDFEQTLKDVTSAAVQGRSGGNLAKFTEERYPDLNPSIYREMMATIEGKRNQFETRQSKMIDVKRQHDDVISRPISGLFVGGRPPLVLKLVTSDRTDGAFASGRDNEVSLHAKK